MKILIDECLPERLKILLEEFEVYSVSEMGWKSLKNGKLLKVAVENGFESFLTIDKKLMYQQNLKSFNIAVVVFDIYRSKLELIFSFNSKVKRNIANFKKRDCNYFKINFKTSSLKHLL